MVRLSVHALDAGGHGVARNAEGKVVFVEGALGGEIVEAAVTRSRPKFDTARTVAVLKASSAPSTNTTLPSALRAMPWPAASSAWTFSRTNG